MRWKCVFYLVLWMIETKFINSDNCLRTRLMAYRKPYVTHPRKSIIHYPSQYFLITILFNFKLCHNNYQPEVLQKFIFRILRQLVINPTEQENEKQLIFLLGNFHATKIRNQQFLISEKSFRCCFENHPHLATCVHGQSQYKTK